MGHLLRLAFLRRFEEIFSLIFAGVLLVLPNSAPTTTFSPDRVPMREAVELAAVNPELSTEKVAVETTKAARYVATVAKTTLTATKSNYITVNGHTTSIVSTGDPNIDHDPGAYVKKWGQFLYGHNYPEILGTIRYLPIGSMVAINLDGETRNYEIVNRVKMDLPTTKRFLNAFYRGDYRGGHYSFVIMTCAGERYDKTGKDLDRTITFVK